MKRTLSCLLCCVLAIGCVACDGIADVSAFYPQSYDKSPEPSDSDVSAQRNDWWYEPNSDGTPPSSGASTEALALYDAYYLGDTSQNIIYLTFDTGYENGYTERILDALKDNNVKAAFFVTRSMLKTRPDLAQRMADEGHVVGNHLCTHPDMTTLTDAEIAAELNECAELYEDITSQPMSHFMRPPEGAFSEQSLHCTQKLGYATVFWSLAYKDWEVDAQPSVDDAFNEIMGHVHPGCITLLHTVSSTNASVLDRVLKALKAQGYQFGSLYALPGQSDAPEAQGREN